MTTTHTIEFDYEVEALGQSVTITAKVRLPPPDHSHPGDPDNDAELEIESVTLNGGNMDADSIKVLRKKLIPPPEWHLLTDLLREAAWERAEMEAA